MAKSVKQIIGKLIMIIISIKQKDDLISRKIFQIKMIVKRQNTKFYLTTST